MTHELPDDFFLFRGFSDEKRRALKDRLIFKVASYTEGETVFSPGKSERLLGYIASGTVNVYRNTAENSVLLNRLFAGDSFGASALFGEEDTFPTHLVAKNDVTILFISQKDLETFLFSCPEAAMNYIAFLSDRIRFLNRRIRGFAAGSTEEKVACFFLENEKNGAVSLKNLSQLASSLSLGRASLYRVIDAMTERGVIDRDQNTIIIKNKSELERITKT